MASLFFILTVNAVFTRILSVPQLVVIGLFLHLHTLHGYAYSSLSRIGQLNKHDKNSLNEQAARGYGGITGNWEMFQSRIREHRKKLAFSYGLSQRTRARNIAH